MERIELNGVWYIREKKSIKIDYSITNLDVITYRNGDSIPQVKDSKEWSELTTGAYCYYDNDPSKGILYNWYAVNDPRGLAPLGWKIPDNKEMDKLNLKTNFQFNGYRSNSGNFDSIGAFGFWWSSSEYAPSDAWYRDLGNFYDGDVDRGSSDKQDGFSVRCLRDNVKTIKEDDLKDWDVTLNDGLENEVWDEKLIQDLINETVPEPFATPEELQEKPYVSDDFQIGPDGAYEHTEDWTEDTTPREKAKSELINLLFCQIMDLTTMSKIELGDDVIAEIRRLNEIIKIV